MQSRRRRSPARRPAARDPHAADVVAGRAEAEGCAKEDEEEAVQGDCDGSAAVGCSRVAVATCEHAAAVEGRGGEHLCVGVGMEEEEERTVREGVGR